MVFQHYYLKNTAKELPALREMDKLIFVGRHDLSVCHKCFFGNPALPRGTGKWRGKGSRAKWGWESVYFRLALEKRRILMYMLISAAPVFYHTLVWFISINCSDVCNTELGRHGHQFPQATDSQM